MDGEPPDPPTLREQLATFGVQGSNLDRLAEIPGLTPGAARAEWASICADPKVKNRAAVLVRRLQSLRLAGLEPEDRDAVRQLESLQRLRVRTNPGECLLESKLPAYNGLCPDPQSAISSDEQSRSRR